MSTWWTSARIVRAGMLLNLFLLCVFRWTGFGDPSVCIGFGIPVLGVLVLTVVYEEPKT